jgi:hypothetical protein
MILIRLRGSIFKILFFVWRECGVLDFLCVCAIVVSEVGKTFIHKLGKKRGERGDANWGPVFTTSLIFGIILGLVAGIFGGLYGSAILRFGGIGWWIAWAVIFAVIFFASAILDDDFPLLGLAIYTLSGLIFGYLVVYLLAYFFVWFVRIIICLSGLFFAWLAV